LWLVGEIVSPVMAVQYKLNAATFQTGMNFMVDKQPVFVLDRMLRMHEELCLVWSGIIHVFLALHNVPVS
jgi:hypothetical protein